DAGDVVQRLRAQRQVGVEATADLADQARPQEQLVGIDFRLGGALLERRYVALGPVVHRNRKTCPPPRGRATRKSAAAPPPENPPRAPLRALSRLQSALPSCP